MPIGYIFWGLMFLWALSLFFHWGMYASPGLLFVLLGLLGWKVFGAAVKG